MICNRSRNTFLRILGPYLLQYIKKYTAARAMFVSFYMYLFACVHEQHLILPGSPACYFPTPFFTA